MKTRSAFVAGLLLSPGLLSFAAKTASTGPDPDAILKDLYRAHDAEKGPFFDKENRTVLEHTSRRLCIEQLFGCRSCVHV